MKFKKIVKNSLAMSLVFGTVLGVSGCKDDDKPQQPENPEPEKVGLDDLVDNNVIKEDLVEVAINEDGVTGYVDKESFTTLEGAQISDSSYADHGLLVVKNEANRIGFYSLHYQKYLIAPMYTEGWLEYTVQEDQNVGYFIKLKYQNKWYIYDALGNVVSDESDYQIRVGRTEVVNDEIYVITEEYDGYSWYELDIKKYKANGTLKEVNEIPEPIVEEEEEEIDHIEFGDVFVSNEKIDLAKYGMKGKYASKYGNMYTIFSEEDGSKVITVTAPTDEHYIIGKSIVYQIADTVADDAQEYTYYSDEKVVLKTYSISLETGETKELQVSYVINDIYDYKDKDGLITYAIISASKITEHKTVEDYEAFYLINENLEILEEIDGENPNAMIKIGDNYYNFLSQIIYDENLNEIAYLGDLDLGTTAFGLIPDSMGRGLYTENEIFVAKDSNNKWGAVGYDGKVVIPFIYDNLAPLESTNRVDVKDNCILAMKDGIFYRVNLETGVSTELGENISAIGEEDDLYMQTQYLGDSRKYVFMSQSEDYTTVEIDGEDYYSSPSVSTGNMVLNELLGKYVLTTINVTKYDPVDGYYHVTKYVTHVVDKLPNANSFQTIGSEETVEEELGKNYESAINLNMGVNEVHNYNYDYNSQTSYYEFTAPATGEYIFEFDENLDGDYYDSAKVVDSEYATVESLGTSDYLNRSIVASLQEGEKYYIVAKFDMGYYFDYGYEYSAITVKENTGEYFANPLKLEEELVDFTADFSNLREDHSAIYVEFTPVATTTYKITTGEGAKFILGVTSEYSHYDSEAVSTREILLNAGETLTYKIIRNSSEVTSATFTIELVNKEKDGSTVLNAIAVNDQTTILNNENSYDAYYEYSYTGDKKVKHIKFAKDASGNADVEIYKGDYSTLTQFTLNTDIPVEFNQVFDEGDKVFIKVGANQKAGVSIADLATNEVDGQGLYAQQSLTEAENEQYHKFVPTATSVYGFDVGSVDREYPVIKMELYDEDLNVVDTYTALENQVQLVSSKKLEEGKTYYIRVYSTTFATDETKTYTLTYKAYELYSILNNSSLAYTENEDGSITLDISDVEYGDSFTSEYKITALEDVSINFYYYVTKFVDYSEGSYDGGFMVDVSNVASYEIQIDARYDGYNSSYYNAQHNIDLVEKDAVVTMTTYKNSYVDLRSGISQPVVKIYELVVKLK